MKIIKSQDLVIGDVFKFTENTGEMRVVSKDGNRIGYVPLKNYFNSDAFHMNPGNAAIVYSPQRNKDNPMEKHCETCTCKTPKAGEFWRLKNGNWIMMQGVQWAMEFDNDNKYIDSGFAGEYYVTERLFLNNFEM